MKLTQQLLNERLVYDPETGEVNWRKGGRGYRAGASVGNKSVVDGYLRAGFMGGKYLVHRMIWFMITGEQPETIDHINGNKADNRLENLRAATYHQNACNKHRLHAGTSGARGVNWKRQLNKWYAHVTVNNHHVFLGLFEDLELAELVAAEARRKYHGAFAT